jgi:hypothetical protein
MTVAFRMSGTAFSTVQGSELYSNAVNYDGGSQGAQDAGDALRHATAVRAGRGVSYTVITTRAGAEVIREYCLVVGSTFVEDGGAEPETRAEGRALLKVAARIDKALEGVS